eukprot:scaffold2501_cov423-Prasinococcus_capsulatus_cf.AAC.5
MTTSLNFGPSPDELSVCPTSDSTLQCLGFRPCSCPSSSAPLPLAGWWRTALHWRIRISWRVSLVLASHSSLASSVEYARCPSQSSWPSPLCSLLAAPLSLEAFFLVSCATRLASFGLALPLASLQPVVASTAFLRSCPLSSS